MEHELIPIPSRYRFLLHLLAGMCLGILANCSGDSNLDLYSIQTFLGDINRLVFNNFFDEEMKKVDEIVLNQANNRRNNQNNKHMEIKIKKCNSGPCHTPTIIKTIILEMHAGIDFAKCFPSFELHHLLMFCIFFVNARG